MPQAIDREGLRALVREHDAQVVEVLPRDEYDWAHLPEALHLSLKQFSADAAHALLRPDGPVVVYCNNFV